MNNQYEPTYIEAYFQRAEKVEQRQVHQEFVASQYSGGKLKKPKKMPPNRCLCNPVYWIVRYEPGFDMYWCDTCNKEI